MNYFDLFGLPVTLKVDRSSLTKKYVELQKRYHPDFYTQETEAEQQAALEASSNINKALKVLQNQDETIKYVLQQKGLLEEEEKYTLPPEFLMEMMELNEELSDDSAAAVAAFEASIYNDVKDIIENYTDDTASAHDLLKVKDYYFKKKYLQRILDRMDG